MENGWYYVSADRTPVGPYSRQALERLRADGAIKSETLVWKEGMVGWTPYFDTGLDAPQIPPIPPPVSRQEQSRATSLISMPPDTTVQPSGPHPARNIHGAERSYWPGENEQPGSTSISDHSANNDKGAGRASAQPPKHPVDDDGWQDTEPAPWRRYFARMLDTIVLGVLIWLVLAVAFAAFSADLYQTFFGHVGLANNEFLSTIMTFALVAPVEALILGTTGTTLGKWLFGVRVTDTAGRAIGFVSAGRREAETFLRGLGLGIPIVSLITLIVAYRKLKDHGSTTWDEDQPWIVTYRPSGVLQTLLFIAGIIVVFSVLIALQAAKTSNG